MQPRRQFPAMDWLQRRHPADQRQVPGRHWRQGRVAACTGAADQKWRISQVSFNDFGPIIDTGTGTALTDPGGSTINGTQLVMGPDRGDQTYPGGSPSIHTWLPERSGRPDRVGEDAMRRGLSGFDHVGQEHGAGHRPTPPGIGASQPATSATSGAASPTRPASVRVMPTSTTAAPGLTMSRSAGRDGRPPPPRCPRSWCARPDPWCRCGTGSQWRSRCAW